MGPAGRTLPRPGLVECTSTEVCRKHFVRTTFSVVVVVVVLLLLLLLRAFEHLLLSFASLTSREEYSSYPSFSSLILLP